MTVEGGGEEVAARPEMARILEAGRGGMRTVREDGYVSPLECAEPDWMPDSVRLTDDATYAEPARRWPFIHPSGRGLPTRLRLTVAVIVPRLLPGYPAYC